jgi:predicted aspartyl protease
MSLIPLIIEPDHDDPDCAETLVDGTIGGRPYRFILDTGAALTQIVADEVTAALSSHSRQESSGVFAAASNELVTVSDLTVGPLTEPILAVERAEAGHPGARHLLGMNVLGRHCCHFRLDRGTLAIGPSPDARAALPLQMDDRGHFFVDVRWPEVTGQACWDTGAAITIVDQSFLLAHAGLFEKAGSSIGTDSTGTRAQAPTFRMTGPMIGGQQFAPHKVAAIDLSAVNADARQPMDLILGYPAIRQADWLFDFPSRRWAITRPPTS